MPAIVVFVKTFFEVRKVMEALKLEAGGPRWAPPRKANECAAGLGNISPPVQLFDEFWREGELALMFGPAGSGKSLLAVQVADAIARGRGIEGFRMHAGRRKVLYVDLVLGDAQFHTRYSRSGNSLYRFSENLYRDRPPAAKDLCEWVRAAVAEGGFQAVIIDDLGAVKRTHDGTRETLDVMRELKRLTEETGVSILVLAGSDVPARGRLVSERDLMRSRVLCTAADSVFAIGTKPGGEADARFIIQTRSRNAPVFSDANDAPAARIAETESGMLGFVFEGRFAAGIDEKTQEQIRFAKAGRDAGMTFKAIAGELGISKTRAFRLYKKWTPAIGELEVYDDEFDDDHDDEEFPDEWPKSRPLPPASVDPVRQLSARPASDAAPGGEELPRSAADALGGEERPVTASVDPIGHELPRSPSVPAGPQRISVYDLKAGTDAYGRPIYIADEDRHTGKPAVWYQFDNDGSKIRFRRRINGITTDRLDASQFL